MTAPLCTLWRLEGGVAAMVVVAMVAKEAHLAAEVTVASVS